MAETATSAGLPVPEIEDDGGAVTVRFRHDLAEEAGTDGPAERRELILGLLERVENGLTRREILARLGPSVSERQVRRALEELKDQGLALSPGRGRSGRWKYRKGKR